MVLSGKGGGMKLLNSCVCVDYERFKGDFTFHYYNSFYSPLGTSFLRILEIMKGGKNHELGVSRLATSHFYINVAE